MDKYDKEMFGCAGAMMVFAILANLLFWGALLWFAFFLFDRYVG